MDGCKMDQFFILINKTPTLLSTKPKIQSVFSAGGQEKKFFNKLNNEEKQISRELHQDQTSQYYYGYYFPLLIDLRAHVDVT